MILNPSSKSNLNQLRRLDNDKITSSKRLDRGGSLPIDRRQHLLQDYEEFELAEYPGARDDPPPESHISEREKRRAEKRKRLEEADEMKFSHSIQFNAVPDWSSHYIAYSNLKKL